MKAQHLQETVDKINETKNMSAQEKEQEIGKIRARFLQDYQNELSQVNQKILDLQQQLNEKDNSYSELYWQNQELRQNDEQRNRLYYETIEDRNTTINGCKIDLNQYLPPRSISQAKQSPGLFTKWLQV